MLSFVDFSTFEAKIYLVMDEDALYRWDVGNFSTPVSYWLDNRETYTFKIHYTNNYTRADIAVYKGDECLLREKIREVKYL